MRYMKCDRERGLVTLTNLVTLVMSVVVVTLVMCWTPGGVRPDDSGKEAVVLARDGVVTAQWSYRQLPMHECRWCGRTVNLNRHHAVPQAANPSLRDVRENLIVLCRDCHFVLGHRCDWKRYNPDVMYIATHFTNCVRSADMRRAVDQVTAPVADRGPRAGCDGILHVTNDVPPEQRSALERILKSGTEGGHTD